MNCRVNWHELSHLLPTGALSCSLSRCQVTFDVVNNSLTFDIAMQWRLWAGVKWRVEMLGFLSFCGHMYINLCLFDSWNKTYHFYCYMWYHPGYLHHCGLLQTIIIIIIIFPSGANSSVYGGKQMTFVEALHARFQPYRK